MNKQPPQAEFSFVDFRINSFDFKIPENKSVELGIAFNPSGIYHRKKRIFILSFEIDVVDDAEKSNVFINAKIQSEFKFKKVKEIKDIPDYFYQNSIAIVFPYIRAFISTISLQANWTPMILPLLNLSQLQGLLKENTTEAEI